MELNLPDNNLKQIAREEGLSEKELSQIYSLLPAGNSSDITYLDAAGKCILYASDVVDETYSGLDRIQKTAIKFRLMSKLLNLKAEQLIG